MKSCHRMKEVIPLISSKLWNGRIFSMPLQKQKTVSSLALKKKGSRKEWHLDHKGLLGKEGWSCRLWKGAHKTDVFILNKIPSILIKRSVNIILKYRFGDSPKDTLCVLTPMLNTAIPPCSPGQVPSSTHPGAAPPAKVESVWLEREKRRAWSANYILPSLIMLVHFSPQVHGVMKSSDHRQSPLKNLKIKLTNDLLCKYQ